MEEQTKYSEDSAVIVVDVQADFTELKSGSLAVPGTDARYIETVENATRKFSENGRQLYFTQDWHPAEHISFYTNHSGTQPLEVIEIAGRPQVMWPPHCIQDTPGAGILITVPETAETVRKGVNLKFDSYSGFADDGGHKTQLDQLLQRDGIKKLIVYGLATDYCVKATVLDALAAGYRVELMVNLCRGVDRETTAGAIKEMEAAGAVIVREE